MATNNGSSESTSNNGTEEISDSQDQQNQPTEETSGQGGSQDQSSTDDASGDDQTSDTTNSESQDKPKDDDEKQQDPAKRALLADLHKERTTRQALQARVTELESQVATLAPVKDTLDAVQSRYDRLESFIQTVGGPLARALDSKSFTTSLFESDEDIQDIVKKWNEANPSATSTALSSFAAEPSGGKVDPNVLLRKAAGK